MSIHVEWAGVEDCGITFVSPESEENEDYGFTIGEEPHEHVLAIGLDSLLAIEADSPDQFVEFARTLLRMTEDYAKDIRLSEQTSENPADD